MLPRFKRFIIITRLFLLFLVILFGFNLFSKFFTNQSKADQDRINIVIISLGSGDNINAITLIKSVAMFTSRVVDFYIFVDDNSAHVRFTEQFDLWPQHIKEMFRFKFLTPLFPIDDDVYWNMHLKRYLTLKLYLPELLYSLDSVLMMDSDLVLLNDIVPLWNKFKFFNEKQVIGASSDSVWTTYTQKTPYPFYGKYGLNSGVMLMNLTRLRAFELRKKIVPYYKQYGKIITVAEQCLLNLVFHNNPDMIYDINCAWNFMFPDCKKESVCKLEDDEGIKVVHGAGKYFTTEYGERQLLREIHKIFINYDFFDSMDIYKEMEMLFDNDSSSICKSHRNDFLKGLKR